MLRTCVNRGRLGTSPDFPELLISGDSLRLGAWPPWDLRACRTSRWETAGVGAPRSARALPTASENFRSAQTVSSQDDGASASCAIGGGAYRTPAYAVSLNVL